MSSQSDRRALVGVFVAEATASLRKLDVFLGSIDGMAPAQEAIQGQFIAAHNLRGSAALYGFPGVAGLAEILETTLEQAGESPQVEWAGMMAMLRDLASMLRAQIETIGRTGTEDTESVQAWHSRHPRTKPVPPQTPSPSQSSSLPDAYLNPNLDEDICSYFIPEAQEYLEAIEKALLKLEKNSGDSATIQQLFRTAHTLKGSAYTVGFQSIGDVTHHVEDFMSAIRDGRMRLTPSLTDVILRVVDVVRVLIKRDPQHLEQTRRQYAAVLEQLKRAAPEPAAEAEAVPVVAETAHRAGERSGDRQSAHAGPEPERSEGPEDPVIRVSRERLERLLNLVGELVIGRGRLEQRLVVLEQLSNQVLVCKARMQEVVRTFEEKHQFSMPQVEPIPGEPSLLEFRLPTDFSALEFDQYDDVNILARRVAEVSADVGESMSQLNGSIRKAREDMSQLQRLTLGIRDEIARARMVPIGTPFVRFRRAVREMARAAGKDVDLITSGEHTEVDTGIVERLVDPLIHLVRNAVFHGIELPSDRVARGKSASGTVYLNAIHRGNSVVIEVEDDGTGLDVEKIKARAVALGLVRPEISAGLSDSEAIRLIFLPGFSTVQDAGDQAGRGVGLDVVKRAVEAMNGQIDIETEPGVGTKFTLILPLTLLISVALMVRVGTERYAVPLPSIREVLLPEAGALQDVEGRPVVQLGEEAIEVRSLAALLHVTPSTTEGPTPVVVIRTPSGAVGLSVDELLGRQEIVIKSFGTLKPFRESCFAGATIDPEGCVVLVLDVGRLFADRAVEAPALLTTSLPGGSDARGSEVERPRVLLIDDSLSVRKFVGRMLTAAGYEADTAIDGEDGLLKASAGSYNLIITDLEMPKLNGYELIQLLRDRPETRNIPILVMTTRAGDKHRQMALGLGATSYIAKPVEERALIHEVGRWLGTLAGTGPSRTRADATRDQGGVA
jgi:chemosensory pili system protein ChpA (sensor histidine kinase/response regulator)